MIITRKYLNELTYKVIGCAIEVHKHLGPGLLESVYEKCFIRELAIQGLQYKQQLWIPLEYKGLNLDAELRLDVLVEDILCVELKSMDGLLPIHDAVLLTYMRMLEKPKGILINFNCTNIFKEGQKTLVNELYAKLTEEE
ncbi:MAG: GxxExxY protein [Chitinophagaceae bacterium]